jgi:drug/metabolite transporter (DMT)-like permease
MPSARSPRAIAALCLLSLIWAYAWLVRKAALQYCDPFDFAAISTIPGALLLFAVMAWLKKPLAPTGGVQLVLLGVFQTAGFIGFATWAMLAGPVGKSMVLVYLFPFWTLVIAWPVLGERIRGLQWVAVMLAACGLILVIEPWHLAGDAASQFFAVMSGLCWAVSTVIAKRWRRERTFDPLAVSAWQMLIGGIVLGVLAWLVPSRPIQWTNEFLLTIAYILLLASVGGWTLWLYILKHLSAGVASLGMMAVPVLGVLFSRVHFGEQPNASEITGMLVIAAALALLSWLGLRSQREAVSEMMQE